jgi:O-antigen ligase/polysaccharide polymerase Wzy-like membrane protein
VSLFEVTQPVPARGLSRPVERSRAASFGWQGAIVTLVLLIWLIPVKRYQFPVDLPFKLEPYRMFVLLLLGALLVSALIGRRRIQAAGHGKAVLLLAGAALASQAANRQAIDAVGLQTQSLKALSYFLSFLVVFALVCSALQGLGEIRAIVATLVIGATVVALAALYESRFHNNLFDRLDHWIPFLQNTGEDKFTVRAGRLRVRASSQHPIALAVALLMSVPLALYLARHAASKVRQRVWITAALVVAMGAILTVSRTAVVVLLAMIVTAALLRRLRLARLLPLLVVLVLMTHVARPGAVKALYHAFRPERGLIGQQEGREGLAGSGRISDIRPGLRRWSGQPLFGHGLGTNPTRAQQFTPQGGDEAVRKGIIFDDQYLESLVSLGFVGFVGVLWFFWGVVVKLVRSARARTDESGDLLAACAVATAGFAASMATLDAFSFVQVTLLFCVIAALGLRTRALVTEARRARKP